MVSERSLVGHGKNNVGLHMCLTSRSWVLRFVPLFVLKQAFSNICGPPFNEDILGKIGNVSNSNWLHVDSVFFGFLYQFKVCSIDSSIMIDDKPKGLDLNSYCSNSWGQPLISGWISGS